VKVSVQVLTYEHAFCIEKCLESIANQNFNNFEIVIGVDKSNDCTLDIVREYKSKSYIPMKIIEQKHRVGAFKNFTDVINACSGEYIAICDGDDYWTDPNKLLFQYKFMKNDPKMFISFHNSKMIDSSGNVLGVLPDQRHRNKPVSQYYLIKNESIMPSSSIMYKNYRLNDFLHNFSKLSNIVDLPLMIYLSKFGEIGYINRVMSTYIQASNIEAFTSKNSSYRNIEGITMFKQIELFTKFKYYNIIKKKILRNYINIFLFEITKNELTIAKTVLIIIRKYYYDEITKVSIFNLYILFFLRKILGIRITEIYFKILIRVNLLNYV